MSMYPIASQVLTSSGAITFSNISQAFTHLQLRMFIRSDFAAVADGWIIRFNSDSNNNYSTHFLQGDGSSATSGSTTSSNSIRVTQAPGANATSNVFGSVIIDILDYTNTNKNKTIRALSGFDNNGSGRVALDSGLYFGNTNAITTISLFPNNSNNFVANSRFDLYGISTSSATGA